MNYSLAILTAMAFVGCSSSGVDIFPLIAQTTTDHVVQTATDGQKAAKVPDQRRPSAVRTLDELLLFQPTKYPNGNWEPEQLTFSDVWTTSKDGTKIHGWFCPTEQPKAVVLYCHGNGGNLTGRESTLRFLQQQMGVSVLIFDYRGYGRSKGKATVAGAISDAIAARTELAKLANVNESDIVLMGRSLGGAIAIQLAADAPPRGLIIESSFSSLREVASEHFPKLAWLVAKNKLDSTLAIAEVRCPLLQSHGDADRVISCESGRRLFAAAKHPKRFITLNGLGHNDGPTQDYYDAMADFLDTLPKKDKGR
ncbi:MAG: alpha/beta hydrolase [Planctomycetaceae bacterium]|nr:alpha/beta hydrolase [Planctomycetaceae bacterium]